MERSVNDYSAGAIITKLSPWGDWWNEFTQPDVYLQFADGKRELLFLRHNPERWVLPGKGHFGTYEKKTIPFIKQADG